MAVSVNSGSPKLKEIDESTAALLRFDGEKVAAFVTVQGLYESAETGKAIPIPAYRPTKQPTGRQRIRRPGIAKPKQVNVKGASE